MRRRPTAVRRYLSEFLKDPRVVEISRPLWWLILHGVILRVRPSRSARAYQAVWTERGSPLLDVARARPPGCKSAWRSASASSALVELGMRYGNPSVAESLGRMKEANVRRLLVLPLYPQYSGTTTASVFDAVTDELSTWRWLPELRFINQYHDNRNYINAITDSILAAWDEQGEPERLLFSFHGIPKRYFMAGDPYHCHCHKTARMVAEGLGLRKTAGWCPSSPGSDAMNGCSPTPTRRSSSGAATASRACTSWPPAFRPTAWRPWKRSM
jgi:ferrochelatase